MRKFTLDVVDKQTLSGLAWEVENPKACIVIMEGMEEHISRYDELALYLNKNGYSVYGLDTYGQGENVNKDLSNIGLWPHEGFAKQVIADDSLVENLRSKGNKVYIFAHSMGSFMAQDYIQRFPDHVDKVVLCGSGAKNPAVKIALTMAKAFVNEKNYNKKSKKLAKLMFGNFNAKIKNPRTPYDWLSYNEGVVDTYINDPLCGFGPTNGFCLEFLKGMSRLYKKNSLNKIKKDQQILIISGSEDPVTNYGKAVKSLKKMYNKLGIMDVDTKIFDGLRHEIHNEDRKVEVFDTLVNFFDK